MGEKGDDVKMYHKQRFKSTNHIDHSFWTMIKNINSLTIICMRTKRFSMNAVLEHDSNKKTGRPIVISAAFINVPSWPCWILFKQLLTEGNISLWAAAQFWRSDRVTSSVLSLCSIESKRSTTKWIWFMVTPWLPVNRRCFMYKMIQWAKMTGYI